jgi:hypothetical protein
MLEHRHTIRADVSLYDCLFMLSAVTSSAVLTCHQIVVPPVRSDKAPQQGTLCSAFKV